MSLTGGPAKFTCWPEREDLSVEFEKLIVAAQDGGAMIDECFLTVSKITIDDDNSWYQEWRKTADASSERGNAALRGANTVTAKRNWLRAINYYQAAIVLLDPSDSRYQVAVARMRGCARNYLRQRSPAGEVVTIPWLKDYPLEGYFLASGLDAGKAPVVICMGEPGQRKEKYLFSLENHARDRGIALLAVDLWGEGNGTELEKVMGRPDMESAIPSVMDYLVTRSDVDERRIAILADEWGSSFVARGVAFDPRFAAAVCDGGIWDLHERAFLANRRTPPDKRRLPSVDCGRIAHNIDCPVLVTIGEHGWLKVDLVTELVNELKACRRDFTLKKFTGAETAATQGHADNPTLANEFIFDWLASRLESTWQGRNDRIALPPLSGDPA